MPQNILTGVNAREADYRAVTSPTDESAQPIGLPTFWVCETERSINITLNLVSIERDLSTTENDEARTLLRRLAQSAVKLTPYITVLTSEQQNVVNEISAFVDNIPDTHFRAPVPDPIQRYDTIHKVGPGLLDVVDEFLADKSYVFGPSSQKPGNFGPKSKDLVEAQANCRMICIFCHAVYTRTSDLKRDLRENHIRHGKDAQGRDLSVLDEQDLEILYHPKAGEPNRLRAFGKFSYGDVRLNNWDIKDWTFTTPRTPRIADDMTTISMSRKRTRETTTEDFEDVGPRQRARSTAGASPFLAPKDAANHHGPRFNPFSYELIPAPSMLSTSSYAHQPNDDSVPIDPAILTATPSMQPPPPALDNDLLQVGSQYEANMTSNTASTTTRLARQPSYGQNPLTVPPRYSGSGNQS